MPNIKSAIKRDAVSKKKAIFNKNKMSEMKTTLKKAVVALETSSENVADAVKEAQSSLDRAVSKGLIHKNRASRKKAQLANKLNNL